MNVHWTEAHVKLLSVPPVFDEATATDLVSKLADELVEGASGDSRFLMSLRLTGLLTGQPGCWQISDATRTQFRELLALENPVLFNRALGICVDHMRNGLASTMRQVFGAANANLLVSTLALGKDVGDHAAFNKVIMQLTEGHRLGRVAGETIARVALSQLPAHPDRFRQMEFLQGLQAWRAQQRPRAENHFGRVLATRVADLADAISAHLTGVAMSNRGEHLNAVTMLQRSVATLRELDDKRGLCQTLISLGIAEREISAMRLVEADDDETDANMRAALMAQADEIFRSAQDALNEAASLAQDLQDSHLEAQAHMELAACLERWNDIDAAIEESETARSIMPHDDRAYVRLLTQLGSLYRQNEDNENASAVLNEAMQAAFELGRENIELARLLNVQAAYERRRENLDTAHSYAASSVRIGRKLANKRHLGHALHTLAAITIDQAHSSADLDDAENLLRESEDALKASHSDAGLSKTERTREFLERRRLELKDEPA
jgi:hypothetical protein